MEFINMPTTTAISGIRSGFSWNTEKTSNIVGVSTVNSGGFSYAKSYSSTAAADATAIVDVVSKFYVDEFTLTPATAPGSAGSFKSYDLSGALTDVFGTVISMSKVRYIYIDLEYIAGDIAAPTTAFDSEGITVGGGTFANIFSSFMGLTGGTAGTNTPTILIQSGGNFQLCSGKGLGYSITSATTGDTLLITNNAIGAALSGVASVRVCFAGV